MRGSVNEMVCARAYWGSSAVAMATAGMPSAASADARFRYSRRSMRP
jgi:hypothetical protein